MQSGSNKLIFLSFWELTIKNFQLYKEIGEIPYWLSVIYGYSGIIDDYSDSRYDIDNFRSIDLHNYNMKPGLLKDIKKALYLYKKAKYINILYLIHISPGNLFRIIVYKLGGGKGKVYVKLDMSPSGVFPPKNLLIWTEMSVPRRIFHKIFKNIPDIYTVETKKAYQELALSYYSDLIKKEKLYLMPNGVDPEILLENHISRLKISDKERIIITVGRIGSYQKNTELLLDILEDVDLKNWKIYIIGPIEPSFKTKINEFYLRNPTKKTSIFFTGNINQKDLYDYYNKSRMFIMTSRHESYGFVLAEAAYMNNYIISTDVGIAEELLEYTSGLIVDPGYKQNFVQELQRIINLQDNELNKLVPDTDKKELTWEWILKNNKAIQKLCEEE